MIETPIRQRPTPVARFGVAVAIAVLAVALTLVIAPLIPRTIFVVSFAAVALSAWYGGRWAGLVTGVVCVFGVDWFLIEPVGRLEAGSPSDLIMIAAFMSVSWLFGAAMDRLRLARDAATAATADLQAANRQLEVQAMELEMANEQLQEQALELELANEELQSSTEELEERTTVAEEAEQRARSIVASVTDPVIVYEPDWRVAFLNEPARTVLRNAGVPEPDGRVLWELLPSLIGTTVERDFHRAMASRAPTRFEWRPRPSAWVEIRTYPMGDGLLVYWTDVTGERRAQERAALLADASEAFAGVLGPEEALRTVLGFASRRIADFAAIHLADPGGVPLLVDVAHRDPQRAALARDLERRFPPAPDAPVGVPAVIRTGAPWLQPELPHEILRRVARDESHFAALGALGLCSAIVVPLTARGRVLGALSLLSAESGRLFDEQDLALTEELARRAALTIDGARLFAEAEAARARAEEANRGKSQFLANMSHELRTPLNAIAGYVALLEDGLHGPVTETQRETLARVQRAQRHLLGLINDVLNYARLEAGRVDYDMQAVQVRDVLADVVPMVQPQLAARAHALETRLPEDDGGSPILVWADREKLAQVLLNLLSNATKFTPVGGRIRISLTDGMGEAEGMPRACLTVSDTGVGIPPEQLPAIFEPFVQVGRALNRPVEGSGLGLAISRDLARGMGGDLSVESTPGTGSTFQLTLRRAYA